MIKRSIPWTGQPQSPARFNNSNPLAGRLIALIQGNVNYDALNGRLASVVGTITKTPTSGGIGSKAAEAGVNALVGASANVSTGNLTDFLLIQGATQTAAIMYGCGTYNGSTGTGIATKHSTITGNWGAVDIGSTLPSSMINAGEVLPTSGIHLLVHTRDGTNHKLYRNGVLKATTAGTNGNSSSAAFVQNSLATTGSFSSSIPILFSGRFNKALTQEEVYLFYNTYWQIFTPQQRNIWVNVSGGTSVSVDVTGLTGTSALGTVSVTAIQNTSTSVTGLTGTSALGTVTVTTGGAVSVNVTGLLGTSALGTVSVTAIQNASTSVTGLTGTSALGSVTVDVGGSTSVNVTGLLGTSALGTVSVTAIRNTSTSVTGLLGTSALGSVTVTTGSGADVSVNVTGLSGAASLGTVLVWGLVDTAQTPNWLAISTAQTPNWTRIAT